jgi:hypothetical protein
MRGPASLVALLTVSAVVAAPGCGGTDHGPVDPEALLDAAAAHPIRSADLEIGLRVQPAGIPQLSGPLSLRLDGPYVSGGGAGIPSFDWRLRASVMGFPVSGRLVSTGENVFLSLYGDNYEVGSGPVAAANERIRRLSGRAGGPPLLTLRPRSWLGPARYVSDADAAGTDCARIAAPIRGGRVERELAPLAASMGLSAVPAVSGTARACVGFDDHVLHELDVDARLTIPPAERASLAGATGAQLSADVVAEDVGEPQRITIPAGGGYRPIRDLLLTLGDLGLSTP